MKLYWNFQGGMRVQTKRPSVGEVWIFSGTIQFNNNVRFYEFFKKINLAIVGQNGHWSWSSFY